MYFLYARVHTLFYVIANRHKIYNLHDLFLLFLSDEASQLSILPVQCSTPYHILKEIQCLFCIVKGICIEGKP